MTKEGEQQAKIKEHLQLECTRLVNQVNTAFDKILEINDTHAEAVARVKDLYKRRDEILKAGHAPKAPDEQIKQLEDVVADLKNLLADIESEYLN